MNASQKVSKKKKPKQMPGFSQEIKEDRRVWLGHKNDSWFVCFSAPRKDGDTRRAADHKVVKKGKNTFVETRICISDDAIEALIHLHDHIKNDGKTVAK